MSIKRGLTVSGIASPRKSLSSTIYRCLQNSIFQERGGYQLKGKADACIETVLHPDIRMEASLCIKVEL